MIDPDHVTPVWHREDDEQTCPMFFVEGEYDHVDGKFDYKAAGKPVTMRLNMWPQACGLKDVMNVAVFAGAGAVTEMKLKDKCCYMTVFKKEWCNGNSFPPLLCRPVSLSWYSLSSVRHCLKWSRSRPLYSKLSI